MSYPRPADAADTPAVLMLLTNAYDPDPRVRQEALSLIRTGYTVRLLAWDRDRKSPARECMEGVQVERVFLSSKHGRGAPQLFFYAALYLRMLWRGWRTPFTAIHCHDLDTLPLGYALAKLTGRPLVYDAHESFPDMLEGSVPPIICRALVRLENFLIRRINLLITVGEKLRVCFEQRGAKHSIVVGNWKHPEEYSAASARRFEIRRSLGIPAEALAVVCITQLLGDRKLPELMDAIDACPGIYAIIGGKGALEEDVRARAARNSRIVYTGFIASRDIPAYTCAGDIVYYGFDPANPNARFSAPNKLFEALAAGLPLVTGDFGEIAEVARNGSCGIVLPEYSGLAIAEALNRLRDRDFRERMGLNGLRVAQNSLNWNKAEETLQREYCMLLSGTNRTRQTIESARMTSR